MVLKSKHPHAFIGFRDDLMFYLIKSPPNSYYLPPENKDTTFFVDTIGMVMSKKFPYIKEFNIL